MSDLPQLDDALAGRYTIEREIGAGGMATVYLATDLRHHRKVAIKVLRDEVAESVGAARFLREIEIAAQLQHPNILPLLDSGESAGKLYYVMPFVDGQSLRERLIREHELPVPEAVRLLVEIVDALGAAHARGVVHRDIKPDNIMLSGRHALVADFGVARAVSEATGTSTITSLGVALGTPAYMSPEQAAAEPHVDQRSDIYSVGVMAFQMLTGQLPFQSKTPQQMLAAHVTQPPPSITSLRPGIPGPLAAVVMRCLEKRPADRWQGADELLNALEPLATPSGGMEPTSARLPAVKPQSAARRRWPLIGAGAGIVVAAFAIAAMRGRGAATVLTLGHSSALTTDPGLQVHPAISPDGKLIAFASGSASRMRIFIRPITGGRSIALSDDSTAVETDPRWSPDGTQLLFLSKHGASVAPALGGSARPIIAGTAAAPVMCAGWSPDAKQVVFIRADSMYAADVATQQARLLAITPDAYGCTWSPNGKWIAAASGNARYLHVGEEFGNSAPSKLIVVPAAGGAAQIVPDTQAMHEAPEWSRDGRLLYVVSDRDGPRDLYAFAIGSDGRARGAPTRVTTGLNPQSASFSADGARIAYTVYTAKANVWSVPIPKNGVASAGDAKQVTYGNQVIEGVSVSSDGKWLVYDSNVTGVSNIYRVPVDGGTAEQLTGEPFQVFAPSLSPDGKLVAYHSWRRGQRDVEVKPLDGSPVETVSATDESETSPVWLPDGKHLVYYDQNPPLAIEIRERQQPGAWSKPTVIAHGLKPGVSPDGQWIAYVSADNQSVRAVHPDGRDDHLVVNASFNSVAFGPDARTYYGKRHDANGQTSIWAAPLTGGTPRLTVRFPDRNRQSNRAGFAVGAGRFFFSVEERQSNVWVADVVKK